MGSARALPPAGARGAAPILGSARALRPSGCPGEPGPARVLRSPAQDGSPGGRSRSASCFDWEVAFMVELCKAFSRGLRAPRAGYVLRAEHLILVGISESLP